MKYLVTGANGYIGRFVVKALLDDGHQVIACDLHTDEIDSRAFILKNVDIFSGDSDIYNNLQGIDVCIHLAWRNGFVHASDSHINDLPKHFNFLSNLMKNGVKQIVVMGSMHEVGYWEGAIDENTPTKPLSFYGISKNALRELLEIDAAKQGAIFQWIRGYYIYGDDLKSNSIFSKIIQAANDGKTTFPFTSGKNKYDFIPVEELAKQITAVSEQTEITGIINCCSGEPLSLGEKVEEFIKEHGFDIKLDYGAFPDREYDSPGVWGDATKIKKILEITGK